MVKDLLQVAAWVKYKEGGRAPVIIGQGVGALITAAFANQYSAFCGGVVLSAPCFDLSRKPSLALKLFFKILSDIWPTWRPPRLLSPNFTETLAAPLRLTSASIDTLLTAMKKGDVTLMGCPTNTLILCPEHDSVASYQVLKKSIALHSKQGLKAVDLGGVSRSIFTTTQENLQVGIQEVTSWLEPLGSRGLTKAINPKDLQLVPNADHMAQTMSSDVPPTVSVPKD